MYGVKDILTKEVKEFETEKEVREYFESFDRPNDLMMINVWSCDGSGWNGKRSGIAYGINKNITIRFFPLPHTNNYCEYLALLACLRAAKRYDHVRTDSYLIYNHVLDKWTCKKADLKPFRDLCKNLLLRKNISIEWVRRDKNLSGIAIDEFKKQEKRK